MSLMSAKKLLLGNQQPYAMVNDTIVSSMRINSHSEEVTAAGMFRDGGELRSVSFSKASGNNPPMLRLNRLSNGALIDSFQYRAAQYNGGTSAEASGAFFDGTDLITVEKVLSNVHKHVGISDNYRGSFRAAETQGQSLGIVVSRDGIGTVYNDVLTFYAGFSSTVAKTVTLANSYFNTRFCFDGRNIVFAENGANKLRVHNTQTGALLKTVDLSGKVSGLITAISFDGRNIHVWSNSSNLVYKLGRG